MNVDVLVTGCTGQLGRSLCARLKSHPNWNVRAATRQQIDFSKVGAVAAAVEAMQPSIVINCAAYTSVDQAERDRDLAWHANARGVDELAIACESAGARFLHVSTDYVFDGSQSAAYKPGDTTSPINTYGQTKREGELAALGHCGLATVLRTSWVFSEYGGNFVRTMMRLAAGRDELRVVADQVGCPTYAGHLADVIIEWMLNSEASYSRVLHYTDQPAVSWAAFARSIFECAADNKLLEQVPTVVDIGSAEYPVAAKRPTNSVLDVAEFEQRHWRDALPHVLHSMVHAKQLDAPGDR